jgi:hypothetical protein
LTGARRADILATMRYVVVVCLAACGSPSPVASAPVCAASTAPPPTAGPSASTVAVIPIDLPRAGAGGPPPIAPPPGLPPASGAGVEDVAISTIFSVRIDSSGVFSVDGRPLGRPDELRLLARAAKARDPDVRAVIFADRNASWETVIHPSTS